MLPFSSQLHVMLVCGVTDMRKSINGLSDIVAYQLEQEPCSATVFVFCNRSRNKLKLLQWADSGFWLHYKRLEQGVFQWPGIEDNELGLSVSQRQLSWLLEGLSLQQHQALPRLSYYYHAC